MRRIFAVLFTAALLESALSGVAAAQGRCSLQFTFCTGDTFPLPPGAQCDFNGDPDVCFHCSVPSNQCAPPGAAAETPCRSCTAGSPINLATGDTFITQVDLGLAGLGSGLALSRTWHSVVPPTQTSPPHPMFGLGWTSTYEEQIFAGRDGYVKLGVSDGSYSSFGVITMGSVTSYGVAAPSNSGSTLVSGPSNWTLTLKDGSQKLFDNTTGALATVIDRNGNATQLVYDSMHRLMTVADAAARHLYFTYAGDSSYLVSQVASDAGLTFSYSYDGQGRLAQVTRPDNTTISFQYDSLSRITAVLDGQGKVLESHTYDFLGRGLTSSRSLGAESVTVAYPQ